MKSSSAFDFETLTLSFQSMLSDGVTSSRKSPAFTVERPDSCCTRRACAVTWLASELRSASCAEAIRLAKKIDAASHRPRLAPMRKPRRRHGERRSDALAARGVWITVRKFILAKGLAPLTV